MKMERGRSAQCDSSQSMRDMVPTKFSRESFTDFSLDGDVPEMDLTQSGKTTSSR